MDFVKTVLQLLDDKKITKKALADKMSISRQTLDNWINGDTFPTSDDLKNLSKIMDDLDASDGKKERQYMDHPRETFYAELIEKNEVYTLMPRAVLTDYKIVPDKIMDIITKSNEGEKEAIITRYEVEKEALIAKYDLIVDGHKSKSARLEADVIRLEAEKAELQRQIAANGK